MCLGIAGQIIEILREPRDLARVSVFGSERVINIGMALAISTSGQSPNLIYALQAARKKGLLTIAFSGKDGGRLREVAEYCFTVPSFSIHRIQECHVALLHILWDLIHVAMGEEDVI